MTIPEELETAEAEAAPVQENPYYVIDPERTIELNRSLDLLLLSRRCPSCKARLGGQPQKAPVAEQIKEIAKCCADQEGFIRPEMPMQEIVFRTLLATGNEPVSLEHLHHLITDELYTPINPRSIPLKGLKRVLDTDTYYGFRRIADPTPEPGAS